MSFVYVQKTYRYVYSILNSSVYGKKMLNCVRTKNKCICRRKNHIIIDLILHSIAGDKRKQVIFFNLFLRNSKKTWGYYTEKTLDTFYILKKILRIYEKKL